MKKISITVSPEDFDVGREHQWLSCDNTEDGGIALFIGRVRDFNQGDTVSGLYLEHYPEMTEKALLAIAEQATERWPLGRVVIYHRVGHMTVSDQIVLVGTTSPHRKAAFAATQFIMDYLKTQAPFWKKETTQSGQDRWVEANPEDYHAVDLW